MSALLLVAHGSRDPRSARAVRDLADRVAQRVPDSEVSVAFLDLTAPSVGEALGALARAGHDTAVVVPLLLGRAFHADTDLPGLLDVARMRLPHLRIVEAPIVGDHPAMLDAARASVVATGVALDVPASIALCAIGSRRPGADRRTARRIARVADGTRWTVEACFATTAPRPADLADRGTGGPRVLAPWLFAPGLLWDRACAAALAVDPTIRIARPLAADDATARAVVENYRSVSFPVPML